MRPLTNGELVSYRRCKRQWWLKYVRQLRPRVPEEPETPRSVGLTYHDLMKRWYRGQAISGTDLENADDMSRTMFEGYLEWLEESGADRDVKIVSTERTIEAELPAATTRKRIWAKADVRLRQDDKFAVMDHKTVGSLGDFDRTAVMQTQPLHYMLVERLLGLPPAEWAMTFYYNLARRVKRTQRAHPPFYARPPVYHTDTELKSYELRTASQAGEMAVLEDVLTQYRGNNRVELQTAYPTPQKSCAWDCDFFAVCPLFDQDRAAAEHVISLEYEEGDPLEHHDLGGDS